ncbi:MAG: hypothetical protein CHACPFDD_00117 [Phycisphaerae bacterium]|nr:hypothetical protein [Phycisphaerae bacterium]
MAGNHRIACYDRNGNEQWRARMIESGQDDDWSSQEFWRHTANGPLICNEINDGTDVRALYDQFSQRFVVVQQIIGSAGQSALLLAFSKGYSQSSNDPTGAYDGWDKYCVATQTCDASGQNCVDDDFHYPGLAVTNTALYLTVKQNVGQVNDELGHSLHVFAKATVGDLSFYSTAGRYNSADIPLGHAGTGLDDLETLPMPAHFFGTASAEVMYLAQVWKRADPNDQNRGKIRLIAVRNAFSSPPTVDSHVITVDEIKSEVAPSPRQLCPTVASSGLIEPTEHNIQSAVWRNATLYFVHEHDIDVTGTLRDRIGVRWYEVATNDWPMNASATPSIVQAGLADPGIVFDGSTEGDCDDEPSCDRPVHFIYPVLMPLASGDITLFMTRVFEKGYPDLVWTAHRAGDPAGRLGAPLWTMQAGTSGIFDGGKWGEYMGIALDPSDGSRAWAVGEVGRCLSPPCNTCTGGGTWQTTFHTSAGSYTVPQGAIRTVTVTRQSSNPPDTVTVWIMPPDVTNNQDEIVLNAGHTSEARDYPNGANVTLRALNISGYDFKHWTINGLQVTSPVPGQPPPRQINVLLSGNITAVPVYKLP